MSINNEATAPRQFVASVAAYSSKWIKGTKYWQVGYSVFFVVVVVYVVAQGVTTLRGGSMRFPHIGIGAIYGALGAMMVVSGAVGVYLFLRSRRKCLLTVTGDGITIKGEVYSLGEAQLSLWVDMGIALHLYSGRRRFVLGGRDRQVGPTTPLDVPPVPLVDAWLSASDFDELLLLGGRAAARGPAAGEPVRCLLFPNPLTIQKMGSFAFLKQQRLMRSLWQPQFYIDLDNDTIRVIDPSSNAVTASASVAQVTAIPATYRLGGGHVFPSAQNAASDVVGEHFSTMPALSVSVAGISPLTVGCRDSQGLERRFSWSANVPITNDPPTYAVSGADWVTLVEKLGLAPYLVDAAS